MAKPPLNLQKPFQGRQWLKLLVSDQQCGFRLRPDLDVSGRYLGFSLRSNSLGLRGPADTQARNVIFGTSYAMGIAVNNGENWYERAGLGSNWLNLGLAVGIREWQQLLRRYHCGKPDTAVVLYHPNIWLHCQMYERWRASGKDIFTALRWKRTWLGCLWLELRRHFRRRQNIDPGRFISVRHKGQDYQMDSLYSDFDPIQNADMVARNINLVKQILAPFRRVHLVRIRIKQELVPKAGSSDALKNTCANYDARWNDLIGQFKESDNLSIHIPPVSGLEAFHPFDSHWNSVGNSLFASWFKDSAHFDL